MTEKQRLATERNAIKFRLKGLPHLFSPNKNLTKEENDIIGSIRVSLERLLKNWDNENKKLGLKPGRRYKVYWLKEDGERKLIGINLRYWETKGYRDNEDYIVELIK